MFFAVSGITVSFWLPPLVAFALSFFTSMLGISGAFLLLPFQMSVLGYVSPSVSATNLVFNLVAIPGGVWSYIHEKRMDWRLASIVAVGTLPGLLAGWWLRVHWLLDPRSFKFFVGLVLLGLAIRLLCAQAGSGMSSRATAGHGERRQMLILLLALVIGIVGGAYGIGGGSIMAPVLVAFFGMSMHRIAGATLFGTLLTSVAGVSLYQFIDPPAGIETRPDWALGILFGVGGLLGMYAGARTQKYVSGRVLKLGVAMVLVVLGGGYVLGFALDAIH